MSALVGGALWSCPVCVARNKKNGSVLRATFATEQSLIQHTEAKHAHLCAECDRYFRTAQALANHRSTKHPQEASQ